jgi:hypothetical protein
MQKTNIIVFDTTNGDISCYKNFIKFERTILVLVHGQNYELMVKKVGNEIIKVFDSDDELVVFLTRLQTESCKIVFDKPDNYEYTDLLDYQDVFRYIGKDIIGQVITGYNKTSMFITKNRLLIPVMETRMIPGLGYIDITELSKQDTLLDVYTLQDLYDKLPFDIKIIGICVKDGVIIAAKTNYGVHVPVKQQVYTNSSIPVLDYNYYFDIDNYINNDSTPSSSMSRYIESNIDLKVRIINMKKKIAGDITDSTRLQISNLISNPSKTRSMKISEIIDILGEGGSNDFVMHVVANEIIDDNVHGNILSGRLSKDEQMKNALKVPKDEVIITSMDDYIAYRFAPQ